MAGDRVAQLTAAALADVAEQIGRSRTLAEAAARVVQEAVALTGASWAEVVETPPARRFRVLAATDVELSHALYRSRLLTRQSPPLPDRRASTDRIVVADLATDLRWASLTAAAELGVRSAVLEFLVVEDRYAAGLAVYDHRPQHFTPERLDRVQLLAKVAAPLLAGLAGVEMNEQLTRAVTTNRDIGAAVGILMGAHRLTQQAAFAELVRASQQQNRKLREVADDVITTGHLDPVSGA